MASKKRASVKTPKKNPAHVVAEPSGVYAKIPVDAETLGALASVHEKVLGLAEVSMGILGALEGVRRSIAEAAAVARKGARK